MSKFKIRESYLLLLIVLGLVSLGIYTTYALFTASTTINDVVGITTTLDIGKSLTEYEVITVQPNETKLIELNVVNSYNGNIYYGAWYQIVKGNSDNIQIGLYTERNSNPGSGSLSSSSNINLLVGITNDNSTSVTLYIGVKGSLTNELNLGTNKILIPDGFSEALLVTEEVLEAHKETKTDTVPVNKEFSATGAVQNVTLNAGTYKLEVWGAQGGNYNTTYTGGKGGYSYGTLTLNNTTNLYVYVGKQAQTITTNRTVTTGGFNGGGNGYNRYYSGTYTYAQGGGGATDIRIGQDSLYSRVIVAGGGSGATNRTNGYYGGGTSGGTGLSGYAGSQTSAGTNGSFGTGGSATTSGSNYKYGSAGGGGGWYGGGASTTYSDNTNYDTYSGGGSGYVYTSSTATNYPSGNLLTSTYYLTNAATVGGNTSFTSTSGGTETGHSGDGYAKITGNETSTATYYTIPNLTGLTDLTVPLGTNVSLTDGTTLTCENNTTTGCSVTNISITDTSSLTEGNHVITYTVKGRNKNKYLFNRNVNVISDPVQATLIRLNLTLSTGTPDFSKTSCSSECEETTVGLYKTEDDIGDSYYFRGDVENNYVYFSGFYWRIIRINGDGSIRMIYDGTTAHDNGESSSTDRMIITASTSPSSQTPPFNGSSNGNGYVGYMYGSAGTHANTNDSTIKTVIDNWYVSNIKDTSNEQYVVDAIYCNDRGLFSGTGIGTASTTYNAYNRLVTNRTPTLKCNQVNDRFTKETTVGGVTGNGALTYPIGLITADELSYAGGVHNSLNSAEHYLNIKTTYWTMSPGNYGGIPQVFVIEPKGDLGYLGVTSLGPGIRPVISISSVALNLGTGTKTDPFKIG